MRVPRLAIALVLGGAGCSLFLDTGGLDEPETPDGGGAPDAPVVISDGPAPAVDVVQPPIDAGTDALEAGDALVGPVGDWPFDEGGGSVIFDKSGRSHNGVLSGGLWGTDHDGNDKQAVVFDGGTTNFVSVSGHTDFDRAAAPTFTMTAWARFDDTPSHDLFFSVWFGNQDSAYGIELVDATNLTYWDGKAHIAQVTVPNVVGAWHHFGVVVDGAEARVYFDGARVSQAVADTTPRTATQLYFGHSSFGDYFRGGIDKARFFRVALTDADMMAEKNR